MIRSFVIKLRTEVHKILHETIFNGRISKDKVCKGTLDAMHAKSIIISLFFLFLYIEGIFTGPDIRKIRANDTMFSNALNPIELRAWNSFKDVCDNFLGKNRSDDYNVRIDELIEAYGAMGCIMAPKMHLLQAHRNAFPYQDEVVRLLLSIFRYYSFVFVLIEASDEQGERFHQEIAVMESRYRGKDKVHMLADYCWQLIRSNNTNSHRPHFTTES